MPVTHGVTGSSPVRTAKSNGTLTEWLGSGLQNRVQQFESAGYLFQERYALAYLSFFIPRTFHGNSYMHFQGIELLTSKVFT